VKEIPKFVFPLTRSSTRKFKTQEEPPTTNHPTEKKDDGDNTLSTG